MKTQMISLIAIALLGSSQIAKAQEAPELVQRSIESVHVPNGFDSNDKALIVIDSYLPNPCYKVGPTKAKIDDVKKEIVLEQWVYRYRGMICPQVIVPYMAVVELGILKENNYTIRDAAAPATSKLATMTVKRATTRGPDDYLYAPVSDARDDLETKEITLEGSFTNECMKLDEIKVYPDPKDVIIVLPILKPLRTAGCKNGKFPFKFTAPLPALEDGKYLLHVRSMNGQSVNKLFEIY